MSGARFERFGGATTSFVIENDRGRVIIDAGTGLQSFGAQTAFSDVTTTLLLSHYHHDHLAGFPFFRHLFQPGWELEVAAVPREGLSALAALTQVHRRPFFPVPLQDAVRATLVDRVLDARGAMERAGLRIEWMEVAHPGGASAFRIYGEESSIVIATDVELRKQGDEFLEFARGAQWALLDAQFADAEYAQYDGWGHSTAEDCARFAQAAGIGRLYLTHHDPARGDDAVDALVARARAIHGDTAGAYDGLEIVLR